MTASTSDPLSSKEKLFLIITLFSLIAWPMSAVRTAYAKTGIAQDQSPIFEIKSQIALSDQNLKKQNEISLAAQQQAQKVAEINQKVQLLQNYLESKGSPLAPYSSYLIEQDNWKKIIAISNAESTMGQHCYENNCSGIFGPNGLRTYNSIPDWIADMNQLLDNHYQNMTLNQMDGIYVQPRSMNWYVASSSIYNDLTQLEKQFTSSSIHTATVAGQVALSN